MWLHTNSTKAEKWWRNWSEDGAGPKRDKTAVSLVSFNSKKNPKKPPENSLNLFKIGLPEAALHTGALTLATEGGETGSRQQECEQRGYL